MRNLLHNFKFFRLPLIVLLFKVNLNHISTVILVVKSFSQAKLSKLPKPMQARLPDRQTDRQTERERERERERETGWCCWRRPWWVDSCRRPRAKPLLHEHETLDGTSRQEHETFHHYWPRSPRYQPSTRHTRTHMVEHTTFHHYWPRSLHYQPSTTHTHTPPITRMHTCPHGGTVAQRVERWTCDQ